MEFKILALVFNFVLICWPKTKLSYRQTLDRSAHACDVTDSARGSDKHCKHCSYKHVGFDGNRRWMFEFQPWQGVC